MGSGDQAVTEDARVGSSAWLCVGHPWLGLLGKHTYKEAIATFQAELKVPDREEPALSGLAVTQTLTGDTEQALKTLARLEARLNKIQALAWMGAMVYGTMASRDERYRNDAAQWLGKAHREHGFELVYSSARLFDEWHSETYWIDFRKKLGLPP